MPIFEYICARCGERFELLIMGSRTPVCPKCGAIGPDLEKQFSTFGARSTGGGGSRPARTGFT